MKRNKIRLISGVGVNDATYPLHKTAVIGGKRKIAWRCPFYSKWVSMLQRCYSESQRPKNKGYINTTVCSEWLIFSNFKSWMEQQDWEDKELDKDLFGGNQDIYSPSTCYFIDKKVNIFMNTNQSRRGKYLLGVIKVSKKFVAYCSVGGVQYRLGTFNSELEAHDAGFKEKLRFTVVFIDEYSLDVRVSEALVQKIVGLYEGINLEVCMKDVDLKNFKLFA